MKVADLKRALILHENDSFSPESIKEHNSRVRGLLECGIRDVLGNDTKIEKRTYDGNTSDGEGEREVCLLLASKSWSSFIGRGKFE